MPDAHPSAECLGYKRVTQQVRGVSLQPVQLSYDGAMRLPIKYPPQSGDAATPAGRLKIQNPEAPLVCNVLSASMVQQAKHIVSFQVNVTVCHAPRAAIRHCFCPMGLIVLFSRPHPQSHTPPTRLGPCPHPTRSCNACKRATRVARRTRRPCPARVSARDAL